MSELENENARMIGNGAGVRAKVFYYSNRLSFLSLPLAIYHMKARSSIIRYIGLAIYPWNVSKNPHERSKESITAICFIAQL